MKIQWEKITSKEFEELCWHLLDVMGFNNLEWFGARGRDRGRDLRGTKNENPFPGFQVMKEWIIQCKRFVKRSLTRTDLDKTITWAKAHNPDYLLFITTEILTSDTRDWIDTIQSGFAFKIFIMDKPLLETQLLERFEELKAYLPDKIREEVAKYAPSVEKEIIEKLYPHMHVLREKALDPWIDLLRGIKSGTRIIGPEKIESSPMGSVTIHRDVYMTLPTDPSFNYSGWLIQHIFSEYPEHYNDWKNLKKGFSNYLKEGKNFFERIKRRFIIETKRRTELEIYDLRGSPHEKYFVPIYLSYIIYVDLESLTEMGRAYFRETIKIVSARMMSKQQMELYNLQCGVFTSLGQGSKKQLQQLITIIEEMEEDSKLNEWMNKHKLRRKQLDKNLAQFIDFLKDLSMIIENGGLIDGKCEYCKNLFGIER